MDNAIHILRQAEMQHEGQRERNPSVLGNLDAAIPVFEELKSTQITGGRQLGSLLQHTLTVRCPWQKRQLAGLFEYSEHEPISVRRLKPLGRLDDIGGKPQTVPFAEFHRLLKHGRSR